MVQVEAAQEILIRLAAAGVLHGDHARHGLEQLGDLQHRPHEQVGPADGALAGGLGRADELEAAAEDDDLLQPFVRLRRGGCAAGCAAPPAWPCWANAIGAASAKAIAAAISEVRNTRVPKDDMDKGLRPWFFLGAGNRAEAVPACHETNSWLNG